MKWEDIEREFNSLFKLVGEAIEQGFDEDYMEVLFKTYHRMIDIKEDLRAL